MDYSGVSATPYAGDPSQVGNLYQIEFHAISQPLMDPLPQFNTDVDYGHFVCTIGLDTAGLSFMVLQMQQDTAEDGPLFWPSFFEVPRIEGQPQVAFTGGGTITITKDYDADMLTVTSPVGTQTLVLSHLDPFVSPSYRNTFPLVPQGYGAQFFVAEPTLMFPAYSVDYVTKFSNVVAKENGVTFQTFPLSTGAGTAFFPDNGLAFEPGAGTVFGVLAPYWTITQEAFDQKVEAKVDAASFPPYRIFTFWRSLTMAATEISECRLPESGGVFSVWKPTPFNLALRRTHDDGHNWEDRMVQMTSGRNATVQYLGGVVYVLYIEAGVIQQTQSRDLGLTWSGPVPLGITGTNPFLVIGRQGEQLYFFCTGGNIQLRRSFNGGASLFDTSAITVAAGVAAQTFGAVQAPDGSLVVSYITGGQYQTVKSRDLGLTWSAA